MGAINFKAIDFFKTFNIVICNESNDEDAYNEVERILKNTNLTD